MHMLGCCDLGPRLTGEAGGMALAVRRRPCPCVRREQQTGLARPGPAMRAGTSHAPDGVTRVSASIVGCEGTRDAGVGKDPWT